MSTPHRPSYSCLSLLPTKRYSRVGAFLIITAVALYGLYGHALRTAISSIENPFEAPYTDDVPTPDVDWNARAEQVKGSFKHAYHGYEKHAAPADELKPISKSKSNPFNGWGVTIFDSLDTMLLMGLEDEFRRALKVVEDTTFSMPQSEEVYAPYFETVIRYLGGLLAAYAISGEKVLLTKADQLAELLEPAFNTTSGLPHFGINTSTGNVTSTSNVGLAEVASLQMEYSFLAKVTGKRKWAQRALYDADIDTSGGMLPTRWNISSGQPIGSSLSVGGQADSAHEYLLKHHLLTAGTDEQSLELYLRATTHILTRLLYLSPKRHLLYATNTRRPSTTLEDWPTHDCEHLACFLPGLLALGAHSLPLDNLQHQLKDLLKSHEYGRAREGYTMLGERFRSLKEMHMIAAQGLAETCWLSYADQPTGLGPEIMRMVSSADPKAHPTRWIEAMAKWKWSGKRGFPPGTTPKRPMRSKQKQDYTVWRPEYLLRPEAIESFYIMWKVTGDTRWRQRGWLVYQAIERETRTDVGYAVLQSVTVKNSLKDEMPSFFLAETLKYLYLLFKEDDLLPLDKWVMNTEGHPLPVFEPNL